MWTRGGAYHSQLSRRKALVSPDAIGSGEESGAPSMRGCLRSQRAAPWIASNPGWARQLKTMSQRTARPQFETLGHRHGAGTKTHSYGLRLQSEQLTSPKTIALSPLPVLFCPGPASVGGPK